MSFVHLINTALKRLGFRLIRLEKQPVLSQKHCPYRDVAIYDNDWDD